MTLPDKAPEAVARCPPKRQTAPLELNQCSGEDHRPVKEKCQDTALATGETTLVFRALHCSRITAQLRVR